MSHNKKSKPKADSPEAIAHHKHGRKLFGFLSISIFVALLFLAGTVVLINAYQHRSKPKTGFQSALGIKPTNQTLDTVRSNLKFSVSYNNKQFKPVAYIIHEDQTFVTVTEKDALKADDYAIVYLDEKNPPKGQYDKWNLSRFSVSTNIHKDFFARRAADPAYGPGMSQLDTTEKFFQPKNTDYGTYTVVSKNDVTINGIKYRKVLYSYKDNKYITSNSTQEGYYTVQNNQPYVIQITLADAQDQEYVASLRGLIGNVAYGEKSQSDTYGTANSGSKGQVDASKTSNGANLPNELEGESALKIAAKNQPAVVRVGTNYCAAVTLLLPNKQEYMKMPLSCVPAIGSGSIVSSDGYISTNGHVTRMTAPLALLVGISSSLADGNQEPLTKYLNYLVDSGVMTKAQLTALLTAAQSGDAEALNKLMYSAENIPRANLVVTKEYSQYAIQLGHDPLKVSRKGTVYSFNYGKTIAKAKYIDSDYDPYTGSEGKFNLTQSTTSDVSILKMDGKNYPVLRLGSIDGLKKGDLITAIGYPAFVDGGLETKLSQTVPTVTQGHIKEIDYDSPTKVRKIVGSDTPIAAGNSGGPAIASSSLMTGLNTYGSSKCADENCFASFSVFRDVADYKALLQKNHITLKDSSSLSTDWSTGIDQFAAAQYSDAIDTFTKVRSAYPAFYLADSFINQANIQLAAQIHARNIKIAIVVSVVLLVVCIIAAVILIKRLRNHRKTGRANGYYTMPPQTPSAPAQPQLPPTFFAPTIPAADQSVPAPAAPTVPVIPQQPQTVQQPYPPVQTLQQPAVIQAQPMQPQYPPQQAQTAQQVIQHIPVQQPQQPSPNYPPPSSPSAPV
jgi:S1-C subfamily serine protease